MAVSAHPGYAPYQHAYMQARQPVIHPQHPQHSSQPTHSNPYPSPGPPPSAPPPQGPWGQTHPQQQHPPQPTSHQLPPPPQHAQQPPHYQQPPSISSAPSHMVQHHHNQPPHQNSHPPIQHHSLQQQPPPPPPPQQQQQQQQQQFQPQHQQLPFARTTAIVPTTVDTRDPYAVNEPNRQPLTRNDTLMEVKINQYTQRWHYSNLIRSHIDVLCSTNLLADMVLLKLFFYPQRFS